MAAVGFWQSLLWWRPPCLLERVRVNFRHTETEAITGALWQYRGGWLTLKDATAEKAGREPVALPGSIIIHRDQIAFMQVDS